MTSRYIHIVIPLAPGDTVGASALIRDLLDQYRDIKVSVEATAGDALLRHFRVPTTPYPDAERVKLDYWRGICDARNGEVVHYLQAFYDQFNAATGLSVKPTDPKPSVAPPVVAYPTTRP